MLGFLGVGVDDEVPELEGRTNLDVDSRGLCRADGCWGKVLDRVELARLQRRDHGVGVLEELEAELVEVGLRPVEGRIPLEDGDVVVLILDQGEWPRPHQGSPPLRLVRIGPQGPAVAGSVLRPDVLGQDGDES